MIICFPQKIVAGALNDSAAAASKFLGVMKKICINDDVKLIKCTPTEAESIKLFSNTYLAMRVAFFNELDSFCYTKNLNTRSIIDSLCTDSRIGSDHNNPSFDMEAIVSQRIQSSLKIILQISHKK